MIPEQFSVLLLLGNNPSRNQTEIANRLGILIPHFLAMLDGLVSRALCTLMRSSNTRRRATDIERAGVCRDVLYERSVDLDLVEWKTLKIGERGITGAKIIHGDPNAKRSQLVKNGKGHFPVLQQNGLGNFDLQPGWVQTRGGQCTHDDLHQAGAAELSRRNIDGYMEISWPLACRGEGLPDDPVPHRHDEADLFGQRNECGRSDYSFFWMIPANQSLESADFVAREIYHRLIVEFELAGRQRLAQILFHDATGLHLQVHRRFKKAECAASVAFRPVQRKVGIP